MIARDRGVWKQTQRSTGITSMVLINQMDLYNGSAENLGKRQGATGKQENVCSNKNGAGSGGLEDVV